MAMRLTALFISVLAFAATSHPVIAREQVTVFAAASLKNAIDEIDAAFAKTTGTRVVASYAASSTLAKQIEQGAPADVFISADLQWMSYLADKKLIKTETRINLLGNRLVLIAPADSRISQVKIDQGFDLVKLAGDRRIAVADVRSVPAGRYAKAALEKLGAWPAAEPKLAQAENVRAALAFVARGETNVGIVYETDARIEPKTRIVGTFPDDAYPAVVYPVAATMETKSQAAIRYLDFLRSGTAKIIFEKFGFTFLIRPVS